MTTAFVTGGSSPLGSRLLPVLTAGGIEVIALMRGDQAATAARKLGVTVARGDLTDLGGWRAAATRCDTFIHLAGIRFAPHMVGALSAGQNVIAISSASVANPHHALSGELARHEQVLLSASATTAILRPTMIYGTARDRNLRYLARLLMRLPRVPTFTGGGRIQPVHVDDVVAAIMEQLVHPRYQVTPLGGPDQVRINQLVDLMVAQLGLPRSRVLVPLAPMARVVSVAHLGRLHRIFHAVEMLACDRTVDVPSSLLLGRDPTPLAAGVRSALVTYGLLPRSA